MLPSSPGFETRIISTLSHQFFLCPTLISGALPVPARPPLPAASSLPLPATLFPFGGCASHLSCSCSSVMPLIAAGGRGHDCLLALSFSFLTSAPDLGSLVAAFSADGVRRRNSDRVVVIRFFGALKRISCSVTPLTVLVLPVWVA
jgi:hypothetical protein